MNKLKKFLPWFWVPSIYYAEGIPYIIVMTVSVVMYKRMGISNTDIALYTSWLYLPWVIKPLWSPIVDIFKTKRLWIIIMQLFIGAGLGGVALTIPMPNFFQYTLLFFWLLAFSSATHDIAADGFYMLGLTKRDQAFFVGIRSTFYRFAMITGQGLLIILAGYLESSTGLDPIDVEVMSTLNKKANRIEVVDKEVTNKEADKLELIVSKKKVEINTVQISSAKVDSVVKLVQDLNLKNGFYNREIERAAIGEKITKVGNIGVVFFHLTKSPGEESIVMNFDLDHGDESISLIEGSRFVFDNTNWNKPAYAVFQLDPKLKEVSSASFEGLSGNIPLAWSITFGILAIMFIVFFVYHKFILPRPDSDKPAVQSSDTSLFREFFNTFVLFFKKERIGIIVAFLLLYRLGESQLVKMASPFMLDSRSVGGLGLTTGEVGWIYGTIGLLSLTLGGILGGFLASRHGLKAWLWPMLIAINIPNTVYIYLSYVMPESFFTISVCVALEQFGYGFGFTAYMLFQIYISEGKHKTAHFAITTAFMALGMMIPGMVSGWIQEMVGYQHFFIWVILVTIPAFIVTKFIQIDPKFGKENK